MGLPTAGRGGGHDILFKDDETARIDWIKRCVAGVCLLEDLDKAQIVAQHAQRQAFLLALAAVDHHIRSGPLDHAEAAGARVQTHWRHRRRGLTGRAQHRILAVEPPPLADGDDCLALFTHEPQMAHEFLECVECAHLTPPENHFVRHATVRITERNLILFGTSLKAVVALAPNTLQQFFN